MPKPGSPQHVSVVFSVGDEADRGATVESGPLARWVVKVRAPLDEQDRISRVLHAGVEYGGFCAGGDQCDAVAVLHHAVEPLHSLTPEWRIKPDHRLVATHEASARLDQP